MDERFEGALAAAVRAWRDKRFAHLGSAPPGGADHSIASWVRAWVPKDQAGASVRDAERTALVETHHAFLKAKAARLPRPK